MDLSLKYRGPSRAAGVRGIRDTRVGWLVGIWQCVCMLGPVMSICIWVFIIVPDICLELLPAK